LQSSHISSVATIGTCAKKFSNGMLPTHFDFQISEAAPSTSRYDLGSSGVLAGALFLSHSNI
jgi:hypothetical protein